MGAGVLGSNEEGAADLFPLRGKKSRWTAWSRGQIT